MNATVIIRRVAALAVTLLIPLLVWSVILQPVVSLFFGEPEDLQAERTKFALLKARAQELPVLQARLQKALKLMRASPVYWHQLSITDISATMQTRIRQIVMEAGGTVISTADLASHTDQDFLEVQVRADISQPVGALYRTLHDLESSTPALVVDSLDLKPLQSASPVVEPQVAVDLVLSAYRPATR